MPSSSPLTRSDAPSCCGDDRERRPDGPRVDVAADERLLSVRSGAGTAIVTSSTVRPLSLSALSSSQLADDPFVTAIVFPARSATVAMSLPSGTRMPCVNCGVAVARTTVNRRIGRRGEDRRGVADAADVDRVGGQRLEQRGSGG